MKNEDRLLELQAPCYIMGDLHGNYEDLSGFEKMLWRSGMIITPGDFFYQQNYNIGLQIIFSQHPLKSFRRNDCEKIHFSEIFISWRLC